MLNFSSLITIGLGGALYYYGADYIPQMANMSWRWGIVAAFVIIMYSMNGAQRLLALAGIPDSEII